MTPKIMVEFTTNTCLIIEYMFDFYVYVVAFLLIHCSLEYKEPLKRGGN